MVSRIGLKIRVPDRFFTEDNLAIHNRGDFSITATQVETDSATLKMTAKRCAVRAFRRQAACQHHFKWMFVNAQADNIRIKAPRSRFPVVFPQSITQPRGSVKINPPAATRPKQKLQQPLKKDKIGR